MIVKGVPNFFLIPCFLVLQDWLQCTNYQNSILFHHSLMYLIKKLFSSKRKILCV